MYGFQVNADTQKNTACLQRAKNSHTCFVCQTG